ncbi:TPA: phenylalanine--tRNA ligase subunit alpha [Candidatus Woesearchaeota archaeon]|nr:phenylalanine--tRNA ligase subunit alpha [Candidatus Woesearchaeota archaeon]
MSNDKTEEIAGSLHRLERAVLPHLEKHSAVSDIIAASRMQEVEVMRALNWLQNKGLVKVTEAIEELVVLGENGKAYAKTKMPEMRFLNTVKNKPLPLAEIKKAAGLNDDEIGANIGSLMRMKAIEDVAAAEKTFRITETGKKLSDGGTPAQRFLSRKFPLKVNELSPEEKALVSELKKRKDVIREDVVKNRTAALTGPGKEAARKSLTSAQTVDQLTPEMLATGSWEKASFRPYNLATQAPRAFFGKLQPYREFLEEVREKFAALGFEEMTGPIIESEFWNMDALFMPQFHSARDIHDAYYVKEPKSATDLPQQLVKKVKSAHENGFGTGSRGWRYQFSEEKTARLIMRSQTTACSARKLASADLKIPGKYFAIGRCFRYDVIDAKHLADFNQVEGIVVEEKMNLRQLIGLLKLFAREFCGTDQVKVVPSYFPFTEPSASLYAKHPQLGWMELAGAGIFRPEMVKPLVGRQAGVLAWGIGIDRIAMFKLGLNDIRQLFSHDLNFLRNARVIA